MRYATLLSGGKDSCLAHHVAHQWGWDPVAAIVIRPSDPESHMFHVPNLELAVAQAGALGLPLIEALAPPGEETETSVLDEAFERAREHGAQSAVSGAVESEYQRVRIERAAHRIGLATHAPLWHKDPVAILDTLLAGGFDVRFSAVAAEGLGEDWLGARLDTERRDRLVALHGRYRVHPGGEGGEYESLVLDAPLFQHRFQVTGAEHTFHRDHGAWHVTSFERREKGPATS